MGRTRKSLLLGAMAALQVAACARAIAAADAAELLARGACAAAQVSAGASLAAAEAGSSDPAIADALALRIRIALDCRQPEAPGLDQWIERELALRMRLAGAGSAAVAQVKLQQARRAGQRNRIDESFAETRALVAAAEAAHWPADLVARITDQLSSLHNMRAEAKLAFDEATRAITLAREAGDDATLVHALENQGFALTRQRRGADALQPLGEAERIASRYFGTDSRERAEALRYLAQAHRDAGNFGAAIDALEQNLAILRRQPEIDDHQVAVVLTNLGQTLKISGDLDHAQARYEEALAADARAPDPARRIRPATLQGLANLYRERNDLQRAVKLYAEAVPLFAEAFGAESPQLAQVLNNYANAEANLGHYEEAIAMYRRALAIAEARKSGDPGDYLPLANIAMIDMWRGRYADAESGFRQAIEHLPGTAAGNEASTLFSRIGLAASLWGQRRMDEAFATAVFAEQTRQAALRLAASRLGERQAINFQEYLRPSLDFAFAIAAASGEQAHLERAWELGIAAREQITAISAQRLAAARVSADPSLAPLWNDWREASAALALAELDTAAGGTRLHEAQEKVDRSERALAAAMPRAGAISSVPIRFDDVRNALPADTALVLFAPVQPRAASDFSTTAAEERAPDILAFVLPSARGEVRVVKLGAADELTQRIGAWNAAQSDPHVALAEVRRRGMAAREKLWNPLAQVIANKRVLVLPTGGLHRIAWGAIPDDDGYLADASYVFHALNHERELLIPAASKDERSERLLAIADPATGSAPAALTRTCARTWPIASLPGARREADRLGLLWHERFGVDAPALILEGAAATETRVRGAAIDADVLHFATHGLDLAGDCAVPDKRLAATRGFAIAADAPLEERTSAPATAALVLAPGGAGGEDDGLLTAQEIATLDLSRTRWAVLAACATAAGTARHYEGLFGLARAFRLAGARTVISSLWPVEDAATAQWSEALYGARLGSGLDTAQAIAAAQRGVLSARRERGESTHPYYWAAFVASGDWR
jgi:CHAT domain-containing protein/Tfp pilus assembly protein PilF